MAIEDGPDPSWRCQVRESSSQTIVDCSFRSRLAKEMDLERDEETCKWMYNALQTRYLEAAELVFEACRDKRVQMAVEGCAGPALSFARVEGSGLCKLTVSMRVERRMDSPYLPHSIYASVTGSALSIDPPSRLSPLPIEREQQQQQQTAVPGSEGGSRRRSMPPQAWLTDHEAWRDIHDMTLADGRRLRDVPDREWQQLDPASLPPATASALSYHCRSLVREPLFAIFELHASSSTWPDEPHPRMGYVVHRDTLVVHTVTDRRFATWTGSQAGPTPTESSSTAGCTTRRWTRPGSVACPCCGLMGTWCDLSCSTRGFCYATSCEPATYCRACHGPLHPSVLHDMPL